MTIRPFTEIDQDASRRLIIDGLGEHFGYVDETINTDLDDIMEHYVRRGAYVIVAEDDGALIGTACLLDESPSVGRIVRMSVDRSRRRQGIARALLDELVTEAHRRDMRSLLVATEPDWRDAIGFYHAAGFKQYGCDEIDVHLRRTVTLAASAPLSR